MSAIRRLLIANRGEIACRIMRTAQARGVHCIAVYSDADRAALHVRQANEAVHIGASSAAESYLSIDAIIAAAKASRADAIHPGYGFLSERAAFAAACDEAGIIFVGPSAHAIDLMGDKARAKRAMIEAGVRCVPGYQGEAQDDATLISEGEKIGFPIMVKAAAGGGGKGMRLVEAGADLGRAIATARSEAENAFGSGELILEKAIIRPRHVEIQVFGDAHGNVIHLGERDCSVQRRHQKVVEEAPCPVMTPELREEMGGAAIRAAQSVDYLGAGTVEFLLDADGSFYFLEMNTRLQVEHPVTEQVTGLDLVALQLSVAEGEPLPITQSDVRIEGHSIEVRYYAEDPANDFMPSAGDVNVWQAPDGQGVRVDAGIESGSTISAFYDPMIGKVIATGANRDEARRRLIDALQKSALIGPANNRDFLIDVLGKDSFASGEATTAFVELEYGDEGFAAPISPFDICLAATILHVSQARIARAEAISIPAELQNWSSTGACSHSHEFLLDGEVAKVLIGVEAGGLHNASFGSESFGFSVIEQSTSCALLDTDIGQMRVHFWLDKDGTVSVASPQGQFSIERNIPGKSAEDEVGSGRVLAPLHGKLVDLFVAQGDEVKRDQPIAMIEAMKMQHEILAQVDGVVTTISAAVGNQIAGGDILIEIDPTNEGDTE